MKWSENLFYLEEWSDIVTEGSRGHESMPFLCPRTSLSTISTSFSWGDFAPKLLNWQYEKSILLMSISTSFVPYYTLVIDGCIELSVVILEACPRSPDQEFLTWWKSQPMFRKNSSPDQKGVWSRYLDEDATYVLLLCEAETQLAMSTELCLVHCEPTTSMLGFLAWRWMRVCQYMHAVVHESSWKWFHCAVPSFTHLWRLSFGI